MKELSDLHISLESNYIQNVFLSMCIKACEKCSKSLLEKSVTDEKMKSLFPK